MYINMNDDEAMLPPAGPEAEESSLRLLYSKIYYTNALCKRSKRCTELIEDLISTYPSYC
jgi:hypothetical protein